MQVGRKRFLYFIIIDIFHAKLPFVWYDGRLLPPNDPPDEPCDEEE